MASLSRRSLLTDKEKHLAACLNNQLINALKKKNTISGGCEKLGAFKGEEKELKVKEDLSQKNGVRRENCLKRHQDQPPTEEIKGEVK